jgi:aryl-alcohol dehydrogenase-like predicted oxidoreductase
MHITRVGFGTWAIGGPGWQYAWGDQDDYDSTQAIRLAVDHGINWIDTAAAYGLGHAEQVVAKALSSLPEPDRPLIFTKCGLRWDDADRAGDLTRIGTAASIRRECEDSLRRLRTERIDLYQMHWPPSMNDEAVEEYWPTLLELKAEGKVRAIGLSNHTVGHLTRAAALGRVDTLQPPFSLINRQAAAEVIPWCAAQQVGVIVYSPMQAGLLTGAFTAERATQLPEGDWRSRSADFISPRLEVNLRLADALPPVARRHGVAPAAVAVAWTLTWTGVTGAIVGARTPEQVKEWLPAASLELTEVDLDELSRAITRTGAGAGPVDNRDIVIEATPG